MKRLKPRVVMICSPKSSSFYVFNGIRKDVDVELLIYEHRPGLKSRIERSLNLIKRRAKRLGWKTVIGQIFFKIFEISYLNRASVKRKLALVKKYNLDDSSPKGILQRQVPSVGDENIIHYIDEVAPDVVLVNGTGILPSYVIDGIKAPIINTHVGITPKYRGSHGGYWALANDDYENCGVTVHLIDPGIDTGGILYQARINVTREDTFSTYPLHQIGVAIPLIKKAIFDAFNGSLNIVENDLESGLWSHPTLLGYLKSWKVKGVK